MNMPVLSPTATASSSVASASTGLLQPAADVAPKSIVSARGSSGLPTGANVQNTVRFARSDVALNATIDRPPANTRELFDLLARGVRQGGKLDKIDLGAMETDIQGDGTLLIKFSNGQQLGLDSFVREAQSRGLLAPGAEIRVPVDEHEANEVGRFAVWAVGVTAATGVVIEAYERSSATSQRGSRV